MNVLILFEPRKDGHILGRCICYFVGTYVKNIYQCAFRGCIFYTDTITVPVIAYQSLISLRAFHSAICNIRSHTVYFTSYIYIVILSLETIEFFFWGWKFKILT